jgi:hypothetical protein
MQQPEAQMLQALANMAQNQTAMMQTHAEMMQTHAALWARIAQTDAEFAEFRRRMEETDRLNADRFERIEGYWPGCRRVPSNRIKTIGRQPIQIDNGGRYWRRNRRPSRRRPRFRSVDGL